MDEVTVGDLMVNTSLHRREAGQDAVKALIRSLMPGGGVPNGMQDTPRRVFDAFLEMLSGYLQDPAKILAVLFEDRPPDELILLRDVPFQSLCEHHLMIFSGKVHVAYLPSGAAVVGLSKLARLVECHARRFQIQERMTRDICDDLMEHLNPLGAAVIAKAEHQCMACRGIKKTGAAMVTSSLQGAFRTNAQLRAEFLSLLKI